MLAGPGQTRLGEMIPPSAGDRIHSVAHCVLHANTGVF